MTIWARSGTRIGRILLVTGLTIAAFAANAESMMWKAERSGHTVWLIGSIHVASTSFYPLPNQMEEAFNKAEALAVEADVSSADALVAMSSRVRLPEGKTLRDVLPQDLADELIKASANSGIPAEMILKMQPWLLCSVVQMSAMEQMGFDAASGIDLHFINAAHDSGKTVVELESVAMQADLFNKMSRDETVAFVRDSLWQISSGEGKAQLQGLVDAWKAGDADRLDKLMQASYDDSAAAKAVLRHMLQDRNPGLAAGIMRLASGHRTTLVVVGAAHLVGKGSVIEQMRRSGFAVRKL